MNKSEYIVQCCECRRVRSKRGWRRESKSAAEKTIYSHAYCPDCLDKAMGSIDMEMTTLGFKMAG